MSLGDQAVCGNLKAKDGISSTSFTRDIKFRYNNTDNGGTTAAKGLFTFATNGGALTMNIPDPKRDGDVIECMYVAGGNPLILDATGKLYGAANRIEFGSSSGGYCKLIAYVSKWFIAARGSSDPAAANAVAGLPALVV